MGGGGRYFLWPGRMGKWKYALVKSIGVHPAGRLDVLQSCLHAKKVSCIDSIDSIQDIHTQDWPLTPQFPGHQTVRGEEARMHFKEGNCCYGTFLEEREYVFFQSRFLCGCGEGGLKYAVEWWRFVTERQSDGSW